MVVTRQNVSSRAWEKISKVVTTLKNSEPLKWTWSGTRFTRQKPWSKRFENQKLSLRYKRARYYHAQLGRFISRDPLGFVDGLNLYRAYFVPNMVDPSGALRICCDCRHKDLFALPFVKTIECAGLATTCCKAACASAKRPHVIDRLFFPTVFTGNWRICQTTLPPPKTPISRPVTPATFPGGGRIFTHTIRFICKVNSCTNANFSITCTGPNKATAAAAVGSLTGWFDAACHTCGGFLNDGGIGFVEGCIRAQLKPKMIWIETVSGARSTCWFGA